MKLTDLVGNELEVGDLVCVRLDHVVGQILKLETGKIAKGLSIAGPDPVGEEQPPHIIVQIQLTSALVANAQGQLPGVLKIVKPDASK
jgi:hypothetical protein